MNHFRRAAKAYTAAAAVFLTAIVTYNLDVPAWALVAVVVTVAGVAVYAMPNAE